MLMKRRHPPSWSEYIRVWLWPRRSWLRSGQYVTKRILRLTASPHAVAAGVAAGAFTSFMPFLGFHFLIAAVIAWLLRGNLIASALGTFVGNPITFPFIWAATYEVGKTLVGNSAMASEAPHLASAMASVVAAVGRFDWDATVAALNYIWEPVLYPMTIGGLIIGPLLAVPLYFATRRTAILFRESRRDKLMKKAAALRDRAKEAAQRSASKSTSSGEGARA